MRAEGLAVIIGYENVVRGEEETDEEINQDINDGLYDAVNELMGGTNEENLKKAQPYLSMLGPLLSSFGGGDKAKEEAEQKKKDDEYNEQKRKDDEAAKKGKNTTLYVVLGVVGVAVLGLGGFLVSRKK